MPILEVLKAIKMEQLNTKNVRNNFPNYFIILSLVMLIAGLVFGLLSALIYIAPNIAKSINFSMLRPLHVTSVVFWILLSSTGIIYLALQNLFASKLSKQIIAIQLSLWCVAIVGIVYSYFNQQFGGREYWEFNPIWALPISLAWILFIIQFFIIIKKIKDKPVFIWMWMTGVIFFLFTFIENYLWVFPYFRKNFIVDTTIQWKVNGSLVGSWNQLIYGLAFYIMNKINNDNKFVYSKQAFIMYFLGLANLMFNWSHHIYTLPTQEYLRTVGYVVSMSEWIFFVNILYNWKKSVKQMQIQYHYFPYRFVMMADFWVFINMFQAILMSIPALNLYTHGTHITVAHAMGTTIGINSMILLGVIFEFVPTKQLNFKILKGLNIAFWAMQISLFIFWLSLVFAGIKKGIWQMTLNQSSFHSMMQSLQPTFIIFFIAGIFLVLSIGFITFCLVKAYYNDCKTLFNNKKSSIE